MLEGTQRRRKLVCEVKMKSRESGCTMRLKRRKRTGTVYFSLRLDSFDFVPISVHPHIPLTLSVSISATISLPIHSDVPISVPLAVPVPVAFALTPAIVWVGIAAAASGSCTDSEANGRRMGRHCEGAQTLAARPRGWISNWPAQCQSFAACKVAW